MGFAGMTSSLALKLRTNLSLQMIEGAAAFGVRCRILEKTYCRPATEETLLDHFSSAAGGVMFAASSLEAALNEFVDDIREGSQPTAGVALEHRKKILIKWPEVERRPFLEKSNMLLAFSGAAPMDLGKYPAQDVNNLFAIRNALLHYHPEWSDQRQADAELELRVRGRFPTNLLSMPDQFFLPYRCLGFGCVNWAVTAAIDFRRQFSGYFTTNQPYEMTFLRALQRLASTP